MIGVEAEYEVVCIRAVIMAAILVDMHSHRPIDALPGHTTATFADRLR